MPADGALLTERPGPPRPATPWVIVLARSDVLPAHNRLSQAAGPRGRLAIEPAGGISPSVAERGARLAVFDGVLYDRPKLLERLRRPCPWPSSDADLVLDAYRLWGADLASRMNGIYAAVVWDSERDELVAVRDRFGLQPLFYTLTDRVLVCSSSLDAVVRHPLVSATVNRPALADRLCHRWPFPDETYFANVKRLPPGHVLRLRADDLTVVRYWAPVLDAARGWITDDEVEQFDHLLDQAVDRALDRGAPAIYLSGGLDSVTVAAIAADNCRRRGLAPPLALSLVFPEPASEEDAQRRVAGDLGLPQYVATMSTAVGPRGLVRSAMEMSAQSASPLLSLWEPAYEHLTSEGKARGAAAVLTGSGGDEWLTVTPYYAADLLAGSDLRGLWGFFLNMQRSYRLSTATMLSTVLWTYGARPLVCPPLARWLDTVAPSLLRAHRRRRLVRAAPRWLELEPALRREALDRYERRVEAERRHDVRQPRSHYVRVLSRMLDSPVIALELEESFASGRRTGLPLLHPFWDADLVDFLYRVPPRLLNQGGRSKGLVRQSLSRRFPALGFAQHRKLDANNFFSSVLATEGLEAWRSMGGARALTRLGIAERRELTNRVERAAAQGRLIDVYHMWHLLSVEAWLRSRG